MKRIIATALLSIASLSAVAAGTHQVDGYTRKDGTYVEPHQRTNPDNRRDNNWSSQGNTNPNTGREGSVDPYAPKQPRQRSSY